MVLYTNDVHCAIDENIGYGGLALYKKQMMNQTPYVTLVDAGDAIQGAPVGTLSEGGYIIDIMNQTGYDVAVREIMSLTTVCPDFWNWQKN